MFRVSCRRPPSQETDSSSSRVTKTALRFSFLTFWKGKTMETKYNVEYLKILVYIDIWEFREPFLRTQKRKKK